MDRVDAIVVGAGIVGLAIARRLSLAGLETVVLERAEAIGTEISSRNSEVIHAGIYYPRGSLKAVLCVAGRELLYPYCREHGVDHRILGKFIVAVNSAQIDALEAIHAAALANGVSDIEMWSASDFKRLEPDVACERALFSPSTGIIDSHGYMLSLQGELEAAGGAVAFRSPLECASPDARGFEVRIGDDSSTVIGCSILVNAAGLSAVSVAKKIEGLRAETIPNAYYAQGAYFTAVGVKTPFQHLIYPIPEPGGLGVHATLDLSGQVRFGPDVLWMPGPDYRIEEERAERFYAAIRNYWPALPDGALTPAYAGVRPKISGPNEPPADFLIMGPAETGRPGLVNLFGIESPGLTSSLAIAEFVLEKLSLC